MGVHYLHGEVTGIGVGEEKVNSVQVCNLSLTNLIAQLGSCDGVYR